MNIKKFVGIFIAVLFCFTSAIYSTENDTENNAEKKTLSVGEFTVSQVTAYINDIECTDTFELYFSEATGKIPYVDVVSVLNKLFAADSYSIDKDAEYYTIIRNDNGAKVIFYQDESMITFSDFDLFRKQVNAVTLLDIVRNDTYIVHESLGFETRGLPIDIHYDTFEIDVAIDKEKCLIPLQTFSDVFASASLGTFLYNGENVFYVQSVSVLRENDGSLSELGKKYFEVTPAPIDEKYASFNLRELALNFQLNYGLRELHGITKFSDWFDSLELLDRLSATDTYEIDFALAEICYRFLGDVHSDFFIRSPYTNNDNREERKINASPSRVRIEQCYHEVMQARHEFFPIKIPGIQKIGDTVYVTFDRFWIDDDRNYYEEPLSMEEKAHVISDYPTSGIDTIGLIHVANEFIQKNKKIRNVVVDISCNTGGSLDAETFTACWLLGRNDVKISSGITGCQSSTSYYADVNFDKNIDDSDTVKDRRLFCLASNVSFSCANLLASTLEDSGKATLLGSKTAGGSCAIYLTSSATGALFQTSSLWRFSSEKNGAFNDIDDGVSPDYKLTELRSFYNRSDKDGLTAFIRKLY